MFDFHFLIETVLAGVALGLINFWRPKPLILLSLSCAVEDDLSEVFEVEPAREALVVRKGSWKLFKFRALDFVGDVIAAREVEFISEDPATATVSADGVVRGISEGTAQVRVFVDGVPSPFVTVTVVDWSK